MNTSDGASELEREVAGPASRHLLSASSASQTPLSSTPPSTPVSRLTINLRAFDLGSKPKDELRNKANLVVKSRKGAVLSRHTILKADWFNTGLSDPLDIRLQGAPNFRSAELNVFGVGQCSTSGIATILTLNKAAPQTRWLSTREEPLLYIDGNPYALREWEYPLKNVKSYNGISATRLQQMESRLKLDVLAEIKRHEGLLLVHEETDAGHVVPCWIAPQEIQTQKELLDSFRDLGFKMTYSRIPISPEQAPDHDYLDEYIRQLWGTDTGDAIVVNCGMGGGRTTFGMIVAILVRRAQLELQSKASKKDVGPPRSLSQISLDLTKSLKEAEKQTKAVLRLMFILERGLESRYREKTSAVSWALERGSLIDDLKSAVVGDYHVILELGRVLDNGAEIKKDLDNIIDRCDAILNLREDILMNRLRQSISGPDSDIHLDKAVGALERYFCLLAFSGYIRENFTSDFQTTFSAWLRNRQEIYSMLEGIRRRKGDRLALFRPVAELAILHKCTQSPNTPSGITPEMERYVCRNRKGTVLVPNTILKVDHWPVSEKGDSGVKTVEGAPNFRRIAGFWVYGVAQPTVQGLGKAIERIQDELDGAAAMAPTTGRARGWRICWINLREEPLIYVNGIPYVMRDKHATLRNLKSFSGITPQRLGILENRLKQDIQAELKTYDDRILLHNETELGSIEPTWEDASCTDVKTMIEVAAARSEVEYARIPITAEDVPQEVDVDAILETIAGTEWQRTVFVMNCQVGLGRSTMGTIFGILVINWLGGFSTSRRLSGTNASRSFATVSQAMNKSCPSASSKTSLIAHPSTPPLERSVHGFNKISKTSRVESSGYYKPINTLLRVIRDGLECKRLVDVAIDVCSDRLNVRDAIEEFRLMAERQNVDTKEQKRLLDKAMLNLRRYFLLIVFQAYLDDVDPYSPPRKIEKFRHWLQRHQEIRSMKSDLDQHPGDEYILLPVLEQSPGDGVALSTEVSAVLADRLGSVIGRNTMIKHDVFPGSQKFTLQERVPGAQNFRRVSLDYVRSWFGEWIKTGYQKLVESPDDTHLFEELSSAMSQPSDLNHVESLQLLMFLAEDAVLQSRESLDSNHQFTRHSDVPVVCGVGMPSVDGVENVLMRVHGQDRPVIWTSLREEPVLYINNRPYVLRDASTPITNLVATGIARERVERMEKVMKMDALNEISKYQGRILLHDEHLDSHGAFVIEAMWESVNSLDVLTTSEVFEHVRAKGYDVNFLRVPITDEQSPIPSVVDELIQRIIRIPEDAYVIFNCQQGRGRTTTGMVMTCLVHMILRNQEILHTAVAAMDQTKARGALRSSRQKPQDFQSSEVNLGAPADDEPPLQLVDDRESERLRLLRGEYKLILNLVSVLQFGKLSKFITDVAIDICSHMQNLREAVYQQKVRIAASEPDSRHFKRLIEGGQNYLVRYFYLIALAGYLLDFTMKSIRSTDISDSERTDHSFQAWLKERREITNLLERVEDEYS